MAHIEEYIDNYFPQRNGIKINPKRDTNYTLETLTYMTAFAPADKITGMIVNYQKEMELVPFELYECCAGIGGNTLSFLSNPEITRVHSFERVKGRQIILTNNVTAYKLQNKWELNGDFYGIPETADGVAVYFDPPWLPEGISGLKFDKSQYILHDAKVGEYTIEEWLYHLPGASIVVYRVPPGYLFKEIPGWKIIVNDDLSNKKNVRLIIALNEHYVPKGFDYTKNMLYYKSPSQGNRYIKPERKPRFESIYNVVTPQEHKEEKNIITSKIPILPVESETKIPALFSVSQKTITNIPQVQLTKLKTQSNEEIEKWRFELYQFLDLFLSRFISSSEIRKRLLNEQNFPVWEKAFTHKSYDPINSYEILEFLGDSAMELMFKMYLSERYANEITSGKIGEATLTNLKNVYIAKMYQAPISIEYRFPEFVRSRVENTTHIAEDLIESFTGALVQTSNNIKPGFGYINAYNFILWIFENRDIDLKTYMFGPAKTQIQQAFSNLGWGSPVISRGKNSDGYETIIISLNELAKKSLKEMGYKINDMIGTGVARTDKMSEALAYDNALKYFISQGLDHNWIQVQKFKQQFNEVDHPEYRGILPKIYGKMMKRGIIRIEFISHSLSETGNRYLIELHGYLPDAEKPVILVSRITDTQIQKNEADPQKIQLLEEFLKL